MSTLASHPFGMFGMIFSVDERALVHTPRRAWRLYHALDDLARRSRGLNNLRALIRAT